MKGKTEENYILKLDRFYYFFSYYFNKDKDLKKMESLLLRSNDPDEKASSLYEIGVLLSYEDKLELANVQFNKANQIVIEASLRTRIVLKHADIISESIEEKLAFLKEQYQKASDDYSKYKLLYKIYEILEEKKDFRSKFFLEKAISFEPKNTSYLFDTAYNHDEDLISAHFYNKLLKVKPNHATALNNLGVAYGNLKLEISSIEMFKKSLEENESLAAANIANKLISAGFKDEAIIYLNNEKKREEYHENIDHHLSRLHKKLDSEKEKKEEIERNVELRLSFMRNNAFLFLEEIEYKNLIDKQYTSDKMTLTFKQKDSEIYLQFKELSSLYEAKLMNYQAANKVELTPEFPSWYLKKKTIWYAININDKNIYILEKEENKYINYVFNEIDA